MKKFLASLHTKQVGAAGWMVFLPALLLLAKPDFASALLAVYFPHVPVVVGQLFGALLAGIAAALLYLGKSAFAQEQASP